MRTPPFRERLGRWFPALLLVGLVAGCRTPPAEVLASPGPVSLGDPAVEAPTFTLEYLGVGGWLLRHGESALLTAPLFSNPGLLSVALGAIESDTTLIDRFLPPVDDVGAILVGHAHYDHLLDVPWIARRRAPQAQIYGSRTMVHTLMGDPELEPARLVDVEAGVGDPGTLGQWFALPGGSIRFMPLRSGHAPHYMGITLYSGEYDAPLRELPDRARGWREGETLAFLIDLLGPEGEVRYRIHYQDAAAQPPDGFPPHMPDGHPVDLMIVCLPGAEEVDGYPEGIVGHLAPSRVLVGHWEDFFRPRTESLRISPGAELDPFIRRLEGALSEGGEWTMPEPGTVLRIEMSGAL